MRIWLLMRRCRARKKNLLPVGIGLAPEDCTPCLVQLVQRAVFLLAPFAECIVVSRRVKLAYLAVEFIVDLPADDSRMLLVMLSQLAYDDGGQVAVFQAAVIVMPPQAVLQRDAFLRDVQHLGIAMCQPCRRSCRWCADDNLKSMLVRKIERLVKQLELKFPFLRLEDRPSELGDPNNGKA
ncbi:hypothetical protein D3C78_1104460 [compost metagenome]